MPENTHCLIPMNNSAMAKNINLDKFEIHNKAVEKATDYAIAPHTNLQHTPSAIAYLGYVNGYKQAIKDLL